MKIKRILMAGALGFLVYCVLSPVECGRGEVERREYQIQQIQDNLKKYDSIRQTLPANYPAYRI